MKTGRLLSEVREEEEEDIDADVGTQSLEVSFMNRDKSRICNSNTIADGAAGLKGVRDYDIDKSVGSAVYGNAADVGLGIGGSKSMRVGFVSRAWDE